MRWLVAALALLATACATVSPPEMSAGGAAVSAAPFTVEGRLSARRGSEGGAAHFTWLHDAARDVIELATPLGQTLARLTGSVDGVRAEWPDGRVVDARDWDDMTTRALGVPIPVQGLAAWLRGQSRGTTPSRIERDARGRTAVLVQDGWEIVYAYADDDAARPSRLTLRYAQGEPTEVRVVVDRWD